MPAQDAEWPVMRQAFHEGTAGLPSAAVVANSDMGTSGGRVRNGLPSGAMHSGRKVNLGRRNALLMLKLRGKQIAPSFQPGGASSGPVLESATITETSGGGSYEVSITFEKATAASMHWSGSR